MSYLYYFLTIDYAKTDQAPTVEMLEDILSQQFEKFALSFTNTKYPLKCQEYKHKSKKYPEWIHYHCIVKTYLWVDYKEAQIKNWSIKYIRITDFQDMATYAGYIQKDKIDKIWINKYTCY